jgi:pterin-4a-carbinolamine dehydratase
MKEAQSQTTVTQVAKAKKLRHPSGEQVRSTNKLKAERVQDRVLAMGWKGVGGRRSLRRVRQFPDAATAASFALHAVQLALGQGHSLSLAVAKPGQVTLTLHGARRMRGVAEEIYQLAERLG